MNVEISMSNGDVEIKCKAPKRDCAIEEDKCRHNGINYGICCYDQQTHAQSCTCFKGFRGENCTYPVIEFGSLQQQSSDTSTIMMGVTLFVISLSLLAVTTFVIITVLKKKNKLYHLENIISGPTEVVTEDVSDSSEDPESDVMDHLLIHKLQKRPKLHRQPFSCPGGPVRCFSHMPAATCGSCYLPQSQSRPNPSSANAKVRRSRFRHTSARSMGYYRGPYNRFNSCCTAQINAQCPLFHSQCSQLANHHMSTKSCKLNLDHVDGNDKANGSCIGLHHSNPMFSDDEVNEYPINNNKRPSSMGKLEKTEELNEEDEDLFDNINNPTFLSV